MHDSNIVSDEDFSDEDEFGNIQLDMTDEMKIKLVQIFVSRFRPAAQHTFLEVAKDGGFVEEALLLAVINEMILEALEYQITKQEGMPVEINTDGETDGTFEDC